jgi:hypothetical protein
LVIQRATTLGNTYMARKCQVSYQKSYSFSYRNT